jgi:hypothetical protein
VRDDLQERDRSDARCGRSRSSSRARAGWSMSESRSKLGGTRALKEPAREVMLEDRYVQVRTTELSSGPLDEFSVAQAWAHVTGTPASAVPSNNEVR